VIDVLDVLVPAAGAASLIGHVAAVRSLRSLRHRLSELRHRATTDPLTGLANRRGMQQALDEMAADGGFDLVLVDLDHFKPVNDTYGHAAGDVLLVEVAARMAAIVADIDGSVVARLGGDEFVLACPSPAPLAQLLGAEVIQVLAEPIEIGEAAVTVRASVGAVHAAEDQDPARVLAAADAAAYEAKARGGDGLVEHGDLAAFPEIEHRPLVRIRELAGLTGLLGLTGGTA
jgi:diguanylate cyclase